MSTSTVSGSSIYDSSHVSEAWNLVLGVGHRTHLSNEDDFEYFETGDDLIFGLFYLEDLIGLNSCMFCTLSSS